jgi:hypothetical protein
MPHCGRACLDCHTWRQRCHHEAMFPVLLMWKAVEQEPVDARHSQLYTGIHTGTFCWLLTGAVAAAAGRLRLPSYCPGVACRRMGSSGTYAAGVSMLQQWEMSSLLQQPVDHSVTCWQTTLHALVGPRPVCGWLLLLLLLQERSTSAAPRAQHVCCSKSAARPTAPATSTRALHHPPGVPLGSHLQQHGQAGPQGFCRLCQRGPQGLLGWFAAGCTTCTVGNMMM